MKKMFEYDLVRRMYYHDKLTCREINRCTGRHRETIKKCWTTPVRRGIAWNNPALSARSIHITLK